MADVVVERDIAAPPEVVFAMFTEPHLLVRWLGDTAELDPAPGGIFRFTLGDQDACRGEYVELDPPHRLVFTWGWEKAEAIPVRAGSTIVDVSLQPIPPGTHLTLTHRGLDGSAAALHEHGWARFLTRLDAVVAETDPGRDPWDDHPDQIRQEL
ncbi:hypothetical protein BH23ACT10_BH23ACT10_06310 [soil metagenome]